MGQLYIVKFLKALILTSLLFVVSCADEVVPVISPKCDDAPPTNEICQAYFVSWFYDRNTNSCSQIGYSGCSPHGFETKTECEVCASDKND